MSGARAGATRSRVAACITTFAAGLATSAWSQPATAPAGTEQKAAPEVVVTGTRGSAIKDIAPIATFDANAVAATGASTIADLLRTIRAVTQSANGADPIFLLNAQRVSSYQEIGSLPPEAIERVEVLPEQAALKFGYPPDRRVLNFITKRRFRQIEVRGTSGTTTDGGSANGNANFSLTRLHEDSRITAALEYRHTGRLRQSEGTLRPDPDILFDARGNIGATGAESIDPALSALAGHVVTVASVPSAPLDRTLSGFAAGADRPRLFDLGPYRTLVARNDAFKGEAVIANRIGSKLGGSINLSAERSRDASLAGPAPATLTVPSGNPYSPFSRPVSLYRYLTEADPLRQRQTTTTLHAGGTVRGAIAGWQWDLTGTLDQQRTTGFNERGVDLAAVQAAIASGANPFEPFDRALVSNRLFDRATLRTRNAASKGVATATPLRLPAGKLVVTASAEAEHIDAASATHGTSNFSFDLTRNRVEGSIAIDAPLASRREGFLPLLGDVSLNGAASVREVGGFGTLRDSSYGMSWEPLTGLQLTATVKHSATAPQVAQQSTPVVEIPYTPVFDFVTGRTVITSLTIGGNPDLLAEHRRVRSFAVNIKPFGNRELRLSATYEATRILNQTGTVYALTPKVQDVLPNLFTRDRSGRLTSLSFLPINFHRERQRILNVTITANGRIGRAPGPAKAGEASADQRPSFYAGIGPSLKFQDKLQLTAGAPELDLLHGDSVSGGSFPQIYGYAYGGLNRGGMGITSDLWYGGGSSIRNPLASSTLRFSPIFKLNLSGYVYISKFAFKQAEWARKLQLKVEVGNLTNARPHVRDGDGRVPNRFQPDYLDPIGRTVKLTLRKRF